MSSASPVGFSSPAIDDSVRLLDTPAPRITLVGATGAPVSSTALTATSALTSEKLATSRRKPIVFTFARLCATVSICSCWPRMPDAATYNASNIFCSSTCLAELADRFLHQFVVAAHQALRCFEVPHRFHELHHFRERRDIGSLEDPLPHDRVARVARCRVARIGVQPIAEVLQLCLVTEVHHLQLIDRVGADANCAVRLDAR